MRLLFTLLALMMAFPAMAIVNIETIRVDDPPEGWSGNVEFGLDGSTGNTEQNTVELGAQLNHQRGPRSWIQIFEREYGESGGEKDTDETFFHSRYIRDLRKHFAVEGFLQYEKDEFRRLESRALVGAGSRFRLRSASDKHVHFLGLGAFYSEERIEEGDEADQQRFVDYAVRINLYWAYKAKLTETVSFANTLYLQPDIKDDDDWRALNESAMTIQISEQLDFKLAVDVIHDSEPPPDVERTDVEYSSGISWRF